MAGYLNQGFLHRFFGPQQKLHPRDSKKLSMMRFYNDSKRVGR
jgi:hypothetical protein